MTNDSDVARLYERAKAGSWGKVLIVFEEAPALATRCARFAKPTSGWTFLHQAAHFGDEKAARALIAAGGSLIRRSKRGERPDEVAKRRGHAALAELLEAAARSGDGLWEPPSDPELIPSSSAWHEGTPCVAESEMRVAYGSAVVVIPAGHRFYRDSFGRVLIGWHGTYGPPCGMDAEPMVR